MMMGKKKILAIAPTYFPMMGGAERTVDEIYTRLCGMGYQTDLVTPKLGGKKQESKGCFRIYRVDKERKSRVMKFLMYQWKEYLKIRQLIKEKDYDIINITYGFPQIFLHWWLRKKGIPIVMTEFHLGTGMDIIDESQNPWYVKHFLKWTYKNSEAITAISKEQKKFVEKISRRKDVKVIFQGTNEKYFGPDNYDESIKRKYGAKGPLLLTVSRLNKRKNIEDMLKAMAIVVQKFPKAKLVITGKGEEKEKLENLTKKLRIEKNVNFAGFVPEEDLPKLYATADIFLLTSKLEGFGIANAEALASGTPVITYDTKAAGDYILEGKTGYITRYDPKEFADRIAQLLSDRNLLKKMSKESRKLVENRYTWDLYAKNHKKIFDEVIENVSDN